MRAAASARGGPQLTFRSSAPSAGCCPYDLQSCIVTMFYAVRRRRRTCTSHRRVAVRRSGAAANCAVLKNRNIRTRQPIPRQKRFRTKDGLSDGALRIGNLLIASKVPQASDLAQAQGRPRNRFTAAHFGSTFWVTKGGNIIKVFVVRVAAGGRSRAKFIFGGCGGRALREPPKITPLRGATVLVVACGPRDSDESQYLYAPPLPK